MNDLNRVLYECRDHVGVITLNRPEVLNAFDRYMYDGVNQALQLFRDDTTAYVGVLQAAGDRAFSAGADVKAIAADMKAGTFEGYGPLISDDDMVTAKPLIAAVHGYCIGEGVNLMLACDLVVADETAKVAVSEARIGINAVDIPLKLARKISYAKLLHCSHQVTPRMRPGARQLDWWRSSRQWARHSPAHSSSRQKLYKAVHPWRFRPKRKHSGGPYLKVKPQVDVRA